MSAIKTVRHPLDIFDAYQHEGTLYVRNLATINERHYAQLNELTTCVLDSWEYIVLRFDGIEGLAHYRLTGERL